jgi:hypothetical protein
MPQERQTDECFRKSEQVSGLIPPSLSGVEYEYRMPRLRKNGLEQTAAADLWKHTLSQIPTVYGRLVYLASIRDPNSGQYRHHGLATVFGREESVRALRESHEQVFLEWLALSLRDKKLDLERYFSTLEEPAGEVVSYLEETGAYASQAPAAALPVEHDLFRSEMQTLLGVFRNGLSAQEAD